MAPGKALAELALQKRFLRAESEARRLVLAAELKRMTKPLRFVGWWRTRFRPLWAVAGPLAGPLAGLWFAHKSRGLKRWATIGWGVLGLVQKFRRFIHSPSR